MQKNKNTLFCSKSAPVFPKYDTMSSLPNMTGTLFKPLSVLGRTHTHSPVVTSRVEAQFYPLPRSSLARTQIVVTPDHYLHQPDTRIALCHHKAQFVHGCSTVENNIENRQAPLAMGHIHVTLQGSCSCTSSCAKPKYTSSSNHGGAEGPCLRTARSARTNQTNWTLQVKHTWPRYRLLSVRAPLVY